MKSELEQRLKDTIRTIPDFPKTGIQFRDITTILETPEVFRAATMDLAAKARTMGAEVITGIESRGFVFGAPIALELGLPLALARKPGKLPYTTKGVEYKLEYGTDRIEMHVDSIKPGQKVVIVDDLLATGGTAGATASLVEELGGIVAGILFVVELPSLGGRKKLAKYKIYSQISFLGD